MLKLTPERPVRVGTRLQASTLSAATWATEAFHGALLDVSPGQTLPPGFGVAGLIPTKGCRDSNAEWIGAFEGIHEGKKVLMGRPFRLSEGLLVALPAGLYGIRGSGNGSNAAAVLVGEGQFTTVYVWSRFGLGQKVSRRVVPMIPWHEFDHDALW